MAKKIIPVALGTVAAVVALAGSRSAKAAALDAGDDVDEGGSTGLGPGESSAMIGGEPTDELPIDLPIVNRQAGPPEELKQGNKAKVLDLLEEYDAYMREHGVDTRLFSVEEITWQRTWQKYAIPKRKWWPCMASHLRYVVIPARKKLGSPIRITSAYRCPDYNASKKGAEKLSLHQWNLATDLSANSQDDLVELCYLIGEIWVTQGKELKMGMGAYPKSEPFNPVRFVHADSGWRRRYWNKDHTGIYQQVSNA